jgi:hypothetical protein
VTGGDRFRRLEKERPKSSDEIPRPTAADRFGQVPPEVVDATEASGISSGRFAPPVEVLELDRPAQAEQPFLRCVRCRVDSGRLAARCSACGETFDTDEQRGFNEALWREQQASAVAERALAEARAQERADASLDDAVVRRRLAEGLAREARSQALGNLSGDVDDESDASIGSALLSVLPSRNARRAAVALGVGGSLLAVALSKWFPRVGACGAIALLVMMVLALPVSLLNRNVRGGRFNRWW